MNHTKKTIARLTDQARRAVFDQLEKYHDDEPVDACVAALYLGVSYDTLASWRQAVPPIGPSFIRNPSPTGNADKANQKVKYTMGELRRWRKSCTVSGNALVSAGTQAFLANDMTFATMADLYREEPFFVQDNGNIICHAVTITKELLAEYLTKGYEVVWRPFADTMAEHWLNRGNRELFQEAYLHILNNAIAEASAAGQYGDYAEGVPAKGLGISV